MKRLTTTVSSKGQIVLPVKVRQELGIEAGTQILVSIEGGRVILDPETLAAKLSKIKEMRGCTAGLLSGTEMLLEDRRLERERELAEDGF